MSFTGEPATIDRGIAPHPGMEIDGRYRLEDLIAHGGMGSVFRAWDVALERPVAIKLMREELATDSGLVARFLDAARAAGALRSPHVVDILDVGQLPSGVPFMVMERLEGVDLHHLIQDSGRLPADQACRFIIDACAALTEAHAAGIVHRDIKPENLIVATVSPGEHILKVVDFGIAKRSSANGGRALTQAGDSMGSPWYMAPEQMLDPRTVDARADIWALGATLFHAVTGRQPFEGALVTEVCAKVLTRPAPSPRELRPDLPAELDRIILQCLEKEPANRFQSTEELARAIEPFAVPAGVAIHLRRSSSSSAFGADGVRNRASVEPLESPRVWPQASMDEERGLHRRRWVVAVFAFALAAALAIGVEGTTRLLWRSLTDGWLTVPPLAADQRDPPDHPPHQPASTFVLTPRGVLGSPADSTAESDSSLLAERERSIEPDTEANALSPPEIERRKRAYRDFLQSEGLRPLDEVLRPLDEVLDDPAMNIPGPYQHSAPR